MFIRLETSSGVPLSRQIADQIRAHSVSGILAPGDRLPSVRQLAKQLAVNVNTVQLVYERLTSEGLLERRQGDGTFVAEKLPPGRAKVQRELLTEDVDRLANRAIDLGVNPADTHALLDAAFGRANKQRNDVKSTMNAER